MSPSPLDPPARAAGTGPAGAPRADGAPHARRYVPGFGRVDWPDERIDAYARRVRLYHQPTARRVVRTAKPPYLRRVQAICGGCAAIWPCQEHTWSRDRLAPRRQTTAASAWAWVGQLTWLGCLARLLRWKRGPRA